MTSQHPFDDIYKPERAEPINITEEIAEFLSAKSPEALPNVLKALAARNDVESLRSFGSQPDLLAGLSGIAKREVAYSVAHMLIDGSGNHEFASTWMVRFGHTSREATAHLCEWIKSGPDPTKLGLQHAIGLLSVCDTPFSSPTGVAQMGPADLLISGSGLTALPNDNEMLQFKRSIFSEMLRRHSALEIPTIGINEQLIELLPGNRVKVDVKLSETDLAKLILVGAKDEAAFLHCLKEQYPKSSAEHVKRFSAAFDQMVDQGEFKLTSFRSTSVLLDLMEDGYIDSKSIERLWNRSVNTQVGTQNTEACPMHNAVCRLAVHDVDSATRFLALFERSGIDLTELVLHAGEGRKKKTSLLHEAISCAVPVDFFTALLQRGCSLEQPSWKQCTDQDPIWQQGRTPYEHLASLALDSGLSPPAKARTEQMLEIATGWKARNLAQQLAADFSTAPIRSP